jgi:hypothetical protein
LQDDLSLRLLLLEHFVELQVQVAVQGLDEQLSRSLQDVEDLDLRETVGVVRNP